MSGIYAKYHEQIMLLFVYTTTSKRFEIFTCRYLKLAEIPLLSHVVVSVILDHAQ